MNQASTTRLSNIAQIAMTVKDLPRAVAFYRDSLGVRFLFEAPPALAFFDCGGVRLMLSTPEGADPGHHSSVLYFKVPDIEAAHEELKARGVEFLGPPHLIARLPDHELWMAFFKDSEGNTLAVMEEKRS